MQRTRLRRGPHRRNFDIPHLGRGNIRQGRGMHRLRRRQTRASRQRVADGEIQDFRCPIPKWWNLAIAVFVMAGSQETWSPRATVSPERDSLTFEPKISANRKNDWRCDVSGAGAEVSRPLRCEWRGGIARCEWRGCDVSGAGATNTEAHCLASRGGIAGGIRTA